MDFTSNASIQKLAYWSTNFSISTLSWSSPAGNSSNVSTLDIIQHPNHLHFFPVPMLICISVLIQIVGLVGNAIVLFILIRKMGMKTNSNWLIFNLAACDLAVVIFCIPLDIPVLVYEKWIYGAFFCSVYYPMGTAALLSSVFTLQILTGERYWAIVHVFKKQASTFTTKILITAAWISSVIIIVPVMIILKHNEQYQVCYEDWAPSRRQVYTLFIFFIGYAIPLSSMIVLYGCIIYNTVNRTASTMPSNKRRRREDNRLCKLSASVTIAFGVCIFPNHLSWFLYEFGNLRTYKYLVDVRLCSNIMLFMSSALNPIIYGTFSSTFRLHLRRSVLRSKKERLPLETFNEGMRLESVRRERVNTTATTTGLH